MEVTVGGWKSRWGSGAGFAPLAYLRRRKSMGRMVLVTRGAAAAPSSPGGVAGPGPLGRCGLGASDSEVAGPAEGEGGSESPAVRAGGLAMHRRDSDLLQALFLRKARAAWLGSQCWPVPSLNRDSGDWLRRCVDWMVVLLDSASS